MESGESTGRYHPPPKRASLRTKVEYLLINFCVNSFTKDIPYREKKVGEKWLNFLQVTKFFPDENFPR